MKLRKEKVKSTLLEIDGIGSKKKKALINYFGGLQNIKKASIDDLIKRLIKEREVPFLYRAEKLL